MGEVLPDVDVLGAFPSADDVVTPLDASARGIVLVPSLFRPASPQESDQTVKPRPRGPQLESFGSPPYPNH